MEVVYDYNVNTLLFDGIQLYKEEFGTSYTYDDDGNVISVVDLQKKETTYEYDTSGNLTKMLQDNQAKMTYTYDNWNNVKTATSAEGLVYSFVYNTYGNNTEVSITSNSVTLSSSATYANAGNTLSATTDAAGKVTTYGYNANTNVLEWVKYPNDSESSRTEYTYDNMYRLASAQADVGSQTLSASYTYTDDLLTQIQTGSTTYSFSYGNFALRSAITIGDRTLAEYAYTDDGRNSLSTLDYGNGDKVQYTYDEQGRVTKQTYEDGDTATYQYDNNGALATITDSATGRTTTYYYDFTDRLVKTVEKGSGYSHSVGYEYDDINNLTKLVETINGLEWQTSYTYDDDNRVISMAVVNPLTEITSSRNYTYDGFGRVSQKTTKRGASTVLTDAYTFRAPTGTTTTGQIATHTVTAGGVATTYTYTYDNNGNILTISDGTNTTSYAYDTANQLVRENNPYAGKTWVWTYDNAGNILSRKEYAYTTDTLGTATDTVSYGYTDPAWGDLLTSYDGQAITVDEIGNMLSDGTWTYTWEHGRELASMYGENIDGNNDVTITYTYDADGMRTSKTVTTITRSHSYTATVTEPTCTEAGYTTYTCTCGDNYQEDETAAPGHDYTITNNGSVVTGTCTRCGHFYSSPIIGVDPPIRPNPPVSTASYSVEATSNTEIAECTVLSTVTQTYSYVYSGGQLMQEVITTETAADGETTTSTETLNFTYDASGTPLSVTYDNTTYYYVTNIQGDVVAIVNSSGTTLVQYTYDAWGNALAVFGAMPSTLGKTNPLRYRGYVYDEDTGLYYLQSRYYDPEMGRFINADVFASTGQGLLGNNMFAYCGNNPICRVDSSGYFFFTVLGTVVGAAFGALDAVIQGKTGDEFTASVVSGAISGGVSGLAADVLSFTGAAVGVAVGFMAAAGAVGSVAGSLYTYSTTGNKEVDQNEIYTMVGDAATDAVLGGLFAYMGGEIASQAGKIAKKGLLRVAKSFYAKEIGNWASNLAEEALATVTGGVAKFAISIYKHAIGETVEMWFGQEQ